MVQERSSPFSAWRLAFASLLGAVAVVALGVTAMFAVGRPAASLGLRPALLLSELGLVAPGLLLYLLVRAFLGTRVSLLGERPGFSRALALQSCAAGVALWVASLGLFELQYTVWKPAPGTLEAFRALHERLRPAGPLDAVLSVLAIAAAPAICEELLFRGLVLPSLARPLGAAAAAFFTTLLFGAIHVDVTTHGATSLYRVPFACAVGLAFAALRLASGRLLTSTVAHATLNAITFAVAPLSELPENGELPPARPALGLLLFVVGAIAAGYLTRRVARN